ncbi:MAG: Flp pilus assembly protein CpaB [Tepidisphaeraceae bacterium]
MRFKTSVSLMVAVVLGLITAKVGTDMLKKYGGKAGAATKIVVATRDMEPGHVIAEKDVVLMEVSANVVPEKALREVKAAVGRTVLGTAAKSYPMLDSQLSAPGSGSGIQAMIPKGMRAVTVDVSDSGSVAGLLTPGCYVDVISTLRHGNQIVAKTVVENVKVQFVQRGKTSGSSRSSAAAASGSLEATGPVKTVTLVVLPQQAMAIELSQTSGKPRLILRGNSDTSSSEGMIVSQNQLLGIPDEVPEPVVIEKVVEKPAPDRVFDNVEPAEPVTNKRPVEIIRGGAKETIYYDEEGKGAEDGKNAVSGKSPEEAPRTDAGRGN